MSHLQAGVVGFDITPKFHPKFGAWGTTPSMTKLDIPLLTRCIAIKEEGQLVLWYGCDLIGDSVAMTNAIRMEIADALSLQPAQIIWSTSQTHSSGAVPGSKLTGSSICEIVQLDEDYIEQERKRLYKSYIDAGREAISLLQPVNVWAGRGYCDSMSYNTRFPMPTGGVKFSRHHREGVQSGKFFDPTIAMLRFDDKQNNPLGLIFNFCCHPATMINHSEISPDWVGTARQIIEQEIGGAPAMFVQGMCGDVNCHHIFGTPIQAKRNGTLLGNAAAQAIPTMSPVRSVPMIFDWQTIDLPCRPMYTKDELQQAVAQRQEFIDEMNEDSSTTWFCGINVPEQMTVPEKAALVQIQIDYLQEGLNMLQRNQSVPSSLPITVGVLRVGDTAAFLSPGENFTLTGHRIRTRSPFAHTMVCGDTNGLLGYIGDDNEIERGGYETDSFWKMLCIDGFRLAPAKGAVDRIIDTGVKLLYRVT